MKPKEPVESITPSPLVESCASELRYVLKRAPRRLLLIAECEHEGTVEFIYREGGFANDNLYEKFIKDGMVGLLSEQAQSVYYDAQE